MLTSSFTPFPTRALTRTPSPDSPLQKSLDTKDYTTCMSTITTRIKKSPGLYVQKVVNLVQEYLRLVRSKKSDEIESGEQKQLVTDIKDVLLTDIKDVLLNDSFSCDSHKITYQFHNRMVLLINSLCLAILYADVKWQSVSELQKGVLALVTKTKELEGTSFDVGEFGSKQHGIGCMISSIKPTHPEFADSRCLAKEQQQMLEILKSKF